MRGKTHRLAVWGDLACFTRPEMKVERYSYPVMTPSAARGIFDAIYFKRQYGFYWQIERIELLALPRYIALRRNEVKDKGPSPATVAQWVAAKKPVQPIYADGSRAELGTDQKGRTQRQTMALKNVRYRIHAHMRFRDGVTNSTASVDAQFERRVRFGKCFYQPFLGCREFPAWFEPVDESAGRPPPVSLDLDLGWMLYDVFDLDAANDGFAAPSISLFHAVVRDGVLEVPEYGSGAVRKPEEEGDV